MEKITWGILGCGDVAEIKSGPAFQRSANSELDAVMRRNAARAEDFAKRHGVPHWYDNVEDLLSNPHINSIYIATPPATHLEFTLKAIEAGKNIYLEKPMALNQTEAESILKVLQKNPVKLTLAHYRRKLPAFVKVKELLQEEVIGQILFADIQILQPQVSGIIANTTNNWRLDPAISGGGYFHDLAPHHIDLMYHFFGRIIDAKGIPANQGKLYEADDFVSGIASFESGVQLRAVWCFNVSEENKKDQCIIYGSKGSIEFSFFGNEVILRSGSATKTFTFEVLPHVQQPMIEETINYFLGRGPNPCSAEEGLETMRILDKFSGR